MEILTGHFITLSSMLICCLLACFLPSVIHVHAEVHSRKQRILNALKRYCNCISGGVFAGAFFTQFYPHVTNKFSAVLVSDSIWNHPFQLGPSIVFLGFVMTALLERFVDSAMQRYKKRKTLSNNNGSAAIDQEMHGVHTDDAERVGIPVSVYDEDDESSGDTDPLTLPKNDNQVLSDPLRSNRNIRRNPGSHNHSYHHHSTHHHNHFSFEDYQGLTRFIVLFASLGTHSIFEGLALGLMSEVSILFHLFISILVHEVLMALALGISLSHQKMQLWLKFLFSFLFAAIIPVGQAAGLLIQQAPSSPIVTIFIIVLQLLAAGTFLHVMFLEILPQELHNHFGVIESFWVILGYILIPLTSYVTGDEHH